LLLFESCGQIAADPASLLNSTPISVEAFVVANDRWLVAKYRYFYSGCKDGLTLGAEKLRGIDLRIILIPSWIQQGQRLMGDGYIRN